MMRLLTNVELNAMVSCYPGVPSGPSIAATLLAPIVPSSIESAFAAGGGGSPAAVGIETVVIKTRVHHA